MDRHTSKIYRSPPHPGWRSLRLGHDVRFISRTLVGSGHLSICRHDVNAAWRCLGIGVVVQMGTGQLELPGTVQPQYIRCGTKGCRCARGDLHGPYYYRFFWAGGKLKKRYVRLGDVETETAACEARQLREKRRRAARRTNRALIRDMRRRLQKVERWMKLALEVEG